MKLFQKSKALFLLFAVNILAATTVFSQTISDFKLPENTSVKESEIVNQTQFNGYTNHWQNSYTELYRYGNLFKMAVPNVQKTILQSKLNVAEDLGMPGLLIQEGFLSKLLTVKYQVLQNPASQQVEDEIKTENLLITTTSNSEFGKKMEEISAPIFEWTKDLHSYQYNDPGLKTVKAFYLVNGEKQIFVISSNSTELSDKLIKLINQTREILAEYRIEKGWFGAATLLKSVTCTPGHPIEVIGKGMNEGNSWFIFDGYMDFLAKSELENWVKEVNLPVVADAGFSPIYGCRDYEGLQVQDMTTNQAWIDYAHKKGGYAFRPVYDPASDAFEFDGYIAGEGNKKQIDNENVPFISKTGTLLENAIPSMVLFVEKDKPLTNKAIWDAIMSRKNVAVLDEAKMMGAAKFRNTLELLYLDKNFLADYFGDNIDIEAKTDGYNLVLNIKNYSTDNLSGEIEIITSSALKVGGSIPVQISLSANEAKQVVIPLIPSEKAMGKSNPIAIHFKGDKYIQKVQLPCSIYHPQFLFTSYYMAMHLKLNFRLPCTTFLHKPNFR